MKKILLAIPGDSSFLKPSLLTFKQLGWEVRNIDYRKTDIVAAAKNYFRLPKRITDELTCHDRPSIKRVIANSEILRVAKSWKPDLFMTFKGEIILLDTVLRLKKLGILAVNWYPDHLPNSGKNSDFIKAYDCFVYWDAWRTKIYHKNGFRNVLYLPFCTMPEQKAAPNNKRYNINFIANWQAHREAKIAPVAKYGLKIWGGKQWRNSTLSKCYQGGPITVEEMIKIIRVTKINLNVHVVENIYSEGTNVRTFEVTGAGGFLLANKRKSLYNLFDPGKEIEVFENSKELIEKTKFYLKNDFAREKIAGAGWRRTKMDHTYLKRFQALLKYLNI